MHLERDEVTQLCRYNVDRIAEYLAAAERAGVTEIGIAEHSHRFPEFKQSMASLLEPEPAVGAFWLSDQFNQSLDVYVEAVLASKRRGLPVKLGIEIDWLPGCEPDVRAVLDAYPWDYAIGSVHYLDGWAIDVDAAYGWPDANVDQAYRDYFERLLAAVDSGLFDIMAHPDLIKKFGHRPSFDLTPWYRRCAQHCRRVDVAVEVSTAGLRKPVGELYPAYPFLQELVAAGVPLTLGSDAHAPEDVGAGFDRALAALRRAGCRHVAVFDRRERSLVALPAGEETKAP